MTDRLDLPERFRIRIEELLQEYLPGVEVWVYGSRIIGRSHPGSDLDLALRSPTLDPIAHTELSQLREALRNSTIPFLVEARDWTTLPESFHREIERDHVVLLPANRPCYTDPGPLQNPAAEGDSGA